MKKKLSLFFMICACFLFFVYKNDVHILAANEITIEDEVNQEGKITDNDILL